MSYIQIYTVIDGVGIEILIEHDGSVDGCVQRMRTGTQYHERMGGPVVNSDILRTVGSMAYFTRVKL